MSATTLDQNTTARRDYEISEALHTAADMYYQGWIPEAIAGEISPVEIIVNVATPEAVLGFALRHGVELRTWATSHGTTHTAADLSIDPGKAVRIHVVCITGVAA